MRRTAMAALAVLAAGTAGATEIGAVGAVNPATLGAPPEAPARQLRITDRVVLDERVTAGEDGLAQIMLLDQTTLTVGPNSEVVLDRFVYDPDQDAGSMALTLTRGALRFIGGRTTKQEAARLTVPGGLVSVRGGIVAIDNDPQQTLIVFFAGDNATVESGEDSVTLARPGAAAVIDGLDEGKPELRFLGVLDAPSVSDIIATFRSPGDGGGRGGGFGGDAGIAGAAGGATRPPVSTVGQLAMVEEPIDAAFEGRLLDRYVQNASLDTALSGAISGEPPTDIGNAVAFFDFQFNLFDTGLEDGDIVNLTVSDRGRVVIRQPNLTITNAGTVFQPNAGVTLLTIVVEAVNEGFASPNTGALQIVTGFVSGQRIGDFSQNQGQSSVFTVRTIPRTDPDPGGP